MWIADRLFPSLSNRLHDVVVHPKSIYRSILGGSCAVLGVVFVSGFSSGEVFNGQIDADASTTTTIQVDLPFYPSQLPDKVSQDTAVSATGPQPIQSAQHGQTPSLSAEEPGQPSAASNPPDPPDPPDSTPTQPPEPALDTGNNQGDRPTPDMDESPNNTGESVEDPAHTQGTTPKPNGGSIDDTQGEPDKSDDGGGSGASSDDSRLDSGDGPGSDQSGDGSGDGPGSDQSGDGSGLGNSTEKLDFDTCADAYEAGVAPITKDEPGYSLRLDRDEDGIACELNLDL